MLTADRALVNGTTITLDPLARLPDLITYFHVETEGHDVILANGAGAETFVDATSRRVFYNYAEYEAMYVAERTIEAMPHIRITTARLVPQAVRARLGEKHVA